MVLLRGPAVLLLLIAPLPARAADILPIVELGPKFHTGASGQSLTGNTGYFIGCTAETRGGFVRPNATAEIDYSSGNIPLSGAATPYSLAGISFQAGLRFFLFPAGTLQPFLGGGGILGGQFMKIPAPPAGTQDTTQGVSVGYELDAGVDLRRDGGSGSSGAFGMRLKGSYFAASSKLAGISGFELNGYRFTLGFMF
jgi:hypothetical protein